MDALELQTPDTIHAPFGYSHVASIPPGHRLVWTAGQVGITPDGAIAEGWDAQTRVAFENLGRALSVAGAGWADVFKLTTYVVDTSDIRAIRTVRDEIVNTARPPASTLIQVAGLALPELLIEIEAVAAVAPN
jgi:enamine deaminase RidA (YjgF/YER057c/UK114 family)